VSYQVPLVPPAGEWTDVVVPFADFVPVWRGRRVEGHPVLDPAKVTTFGLIVSRQEGPFQIELARLSGYRADAEDSTSP
ncbi:MAG: CIA30 family protein, partial [Acidobacteriota bacterium]|nr:CIA30 family protein [Acidobacteriota bacterium]